MTQKVSFSENLDPVLESCKALGLVWNADNDSFEFKSKFKSVDEFKVFLGIDEPNIQWTLRLMLRFQMTFYDILGLMAPFSVRSRSLLQKVTCSKWTWDDPLPPNIAVMWENWLEELFLVDKLIRIPRHFMLDYMLPKSKPQLHIFCDSSQDIFACVAYLRVEISRGEETVEASAHSSKVGETSFLKSKISEQTAVYTSLVCARAKVTPSKTQSIPRNELTACQIGSRMGFIVAKALDLDPYKDVHYWTDSSNCFYWIKLPSHVQKITVEFKLV